MCVWYGKESDRNDKNNDLDQDMINLIIAERSFDTEKNDRSNFAWNRRKMF